MGIRYGEFSKFIKSLEKKLSKPAIKSFIESSTNRIAGEVVGKLKEATPVGDTRQLRLGWIAQQANFEGDACRSIVQNDTHYAPYVEYGHRQTYAWGHKLSTPRWVEGLFFMTDTMTDMEGAVPKMVDRLVDQWLRE